MIKEEYCAGVIPLRKTSEGQWEILLALHVKGEYWAFPKGHIHDDENENPYSAAERELFEELNLKIDKLFGGHPLKENYQFEREGEKIHKYITYYPAYVKGDLSVKEPHEIIEAKWFDLKEGIQKITFEETRKMLEPLMQAITTET